MDGGTIPSQMTAIARPSPRVRTVASQTRNRLAWLVSPSLVALVAATPVWAADAGSPDVGGHRGASADAGSNAAEIEESRSEGVNPREPAQVKVRHEKKPAKKTKPRVEWKARVIAGWEYERDRPLEPEVDGVPVDVEDFGFFLRQARLAARAKLLDRVSVKVSAEIADAVDNPERLQFLRDAWADLRIHDAFRIRVGRFKRPFSRQALRSVFKIPFRTRGVLFRHLLRTDLDGPAWAMRGIGVMLHGRFAYDNGSQLRWWASVTDPTGDRDRLDVHGRVRVDAPRVVSVAVHGAYRRSGLEHGLLEHHDAAFGADVKLTVAGFRADLEFNAGHVRDGMDRELVLGVIARAGYEIELTGEWMLRPVVGFEFADADLEYRSSEVFAGEFGLNLQWTKRVRVLPQVRIDRVTAIEDHVLPWQSGERYSLSLAVQL